MDDRDVVSILDRGGADAPDHSGHGLMIVFNAGARPLSKP
jgi:hypothetical protein